MLFASGTALLDTTLCTIVLLLISKVQLLIKLKALVWRGWDGGRVCVCVEMEREHRPG